MKTLSLILLSLLAFSFYAQERESEDLIQSKKKLTKHYLSAETELKGFDMNELSYRYYFNDKWNLKVSLDIGQQFSYFTNEVLAIIDDNTYIGIDKQRQSNVSTLNLGVERNFTKKRITYFVGLDASYSFFKVSQYEIINNYVF